ncbi:hypothetical protein QCM77_18915 [Bradyrhizobium sp. SSUT18]|uniref:hypothetical protein n=1 Tax=Bradyrhizobium sp. SSUT18 TaxID=3040602 RepID=UPI002449DEB6|nr:hypothetical protein [Bradyrhizobium sp. SSUT18]MDH2402014.1 hypothetical protein [Bradyrhizobium sp. SSUT18]
MTSNDKAPVNKCRQSKTPGGRTNENIAAGNNCASGVVSAHYARRAMATIGKVQWQEMVAQPVGESALESRVSSAV